MLLFHYVIKDNGSNEKKGSPMHLLIKSWKIKNSTDSRPEFHVSFDKFSLTWNLYIQLIFIFTIINNENFQ